MSSPLATHVPSSRPLESVPDRVQLTSVPRTLLATAARASTPQRQRRFVLRLALTGREQGPEMKALLPLIGPKRVRERLIPPHHRHPRVRGDDD